MSSLAVTQVRCARQQGQARVTRVMARVPHERATAGVLVGASVAALMTFAPAFAGVSLEQPKLKNALVTVDEPAAAKDNSVPDPMNRRQRKAAPAAEDKPAKAEAESMGEVDGLAVQALWPLGIVAAGGGLFALYKVDPGMDPLFREAVKDSGSEGIGYEDKLKMKGGYLAPYYDMSQADRMAKEASARKK